MQQTPKTVYTSPPSVYCYLIVSLTTCAPRATPRGCVVTYPSFFYCVHLAGIRVWCSMAQLFVILTLGVLLWLDWHGL